MEKEALKESIRMEFLAMKAGSKVAQAATDDISTDSRNNQLAEALQKIKDTAEKWRKQIDGGLEEAGEKFKGYTYLL